MKHLSLFSPDSVVNCTIAQPFVMIWLDLKGEGPTHNAAVAAAEREYFIYQREQKVDGKVPLFKAYWIWNNRFGSEWEEELNSFVIEQVRNVAFRIFTESGVNFLKEDAPVYNIQLDSEEIYSSEESNHEEPEEGSEYEGLDSIIVDEEY